MIIMLVLVPGAQVLTLDNVPILQMSIEQYLGTAVITALAFIYREHNAPPYQQTHLVIINIVRMCVMGMKLVLSPV